MEHLVHLGGIRNGFVTNLRTEAKGETFLSCVGYRIMVKTETMIWLAFYLEQYEVLLISYVWYLLKKKHRNIVKLKLACYSKLSKILSP